MNCCNRCKGPVIPLFTGFACKNECDLPESEAKREARMRAALNAESRWKVKGAREPDAFTLVIPHAYTTVPFAVGEWVQWKSHRKGDPIGKVVRVDQRVGTIVIEWNRGANTYRALCWDAFQRVP